MRKNTGRTVGVGRLMGRAGILAAGAMLLACGQALGAEPAGGAEARERASAGPSAPGSALTQAERARAEEIAARAIAFLRSEQDGQSGGWRVNPQGPSFPAITALVLRGMLMQPGVTDADPAVAGGVKFLLNSQQADGGIYIGLLPSYNTAISLSALAQVNNPPQVKDARERAIAFLRGLQYGEGALTIEGLDEAAAVVKVDHPYYGGVGYGNRGRPDLSNLAFALEAMHEAGVEEGDEFYRRAIVFLQRCQMLERVGEMDVNDMPYADGSTQGGFIYATSINRDNVGSGNSFAGETFESLSGPPGVGAVVIFGAGEDGKQRTIARDEAARRLREAFGEDGFVLALGPTGDNTTSGELRVRVAKVDADEVEVTLKRLFGAELGEGALSVGVAMSSSGAEESGSGERSLQVAERSLRTGLTEAAPGRGGVATAPVGAWRGVSRFRAYGTMTYAGFKSYVYAGLTRDDPRVVAAREWMRRNYTLTENPGLGTDGYYYYLLMFGRAMDASGEPVIETVGPGAGTVRDWRRDLIDRLAELQEADGGMRSVDDRWMESDRVLITAYSLIALQHALRD